MVALTVGMVTYMMINRSALSSMTVGTFIMPISALIVAGGNMLDGTVNLSFIQFHPIAFMMIMGIVFQGLAEYFISPRLLEYFSLQAPKGEEALYLGFSHLHSFISNVVGLILSGFLLTKYCPPERLFNSHTEWQVATAKAHYICYYFAAIAAFSAISLIIYGKVMSYLDSKQATMATLKPIEEGI